MSGNLVFPALDEKVVSFFAKNPAELPEMKPTKGMR